MSFDSLNIAPNVGAPNVGAPNVCLFGEVIANIKINKPAFAGSTGRWRRPKLAKLLTAAWKASQDDADLETVRRPRMN